MTEERKTLVVGIDPGVNGAIAAVRITTGELVYAVDMPKQTKKSGKGTRSYTPVSMLRRYVRDRRIAVVWLELVHQRGQQGVPSGTTMIRNAGILEGAFGMVADVHTKAPHLWKKAMGIPPVDTEGLTPSQATSARKELARAAAIELWPHEENGLFRRVEDADRAEAALLAEYGRRQMESA